MLPGPQSAAPDEYPDAGDNAPPGVQKEVDNFKQQPPGDRGVMLYNLLGSGTPEYKMSQEESEYTDNSTVEGQTCGNCKFAYQQVGSERFICSQIRGDIVPEGWCKLWQAIEKMANVDMFKSAMLLNICK